MKSTEVIKCQGSDCRGAEHEAENMRCCGVCGKFICAWCLVHCNPSHKCQTLEDTQAEIHRVRERAKAMEPHEDDDVDA